MTNLRSDSPISRRIVLSFLDFLNSVEPAPGVDPEGIDVATQCLKEVFKLNSCSDTNDIQPGALARLFSALENGDRCEEQSASGASTRLNTSCLASSTEEDHPQPSKYVGKDFEDELLGKFINSLERANFFRASSNEDEDPELVEKAMKMFNDTLKEIEMSERETLNLNKLADVFKLRGNRSIESKSYKEAVELYTCAIALCDTDTNAVYYCNRAAAFTHMQKYTEAIQDCLKAIEINPSYTKAYSRLGIAHYTQGNYAAALSDFHKALQLDPNNAGVRENIQATRLKLILEQNQQNQGSSRQPGESSNQSTHFTAFAHNTSPPPEFTSVGGFPSFDFNVSASEFPPSGAFSSFNINAANLPPEMNNMFRAPGQATNPVNSSFTFAEGPDELRDTVTAIMNRIISQQNGSQQNADRDSNQP